MNKLFPIFRPPFKVGLRTQLTIMVCIIALTSLMVLAVITCLYFTSNYTSMRNKDLTLAAKLKSSQIDLSLYFLYYQCKGLTSNVDIINALQNYRVASDKKAVNFTEAKETLNKFLDTSNNSWSLRVYDKGFTRLLSLTRMGTTISEEVLKELFPLDTQDPLPASINKDGMLKNPVLNAGKYLMSMTVPIFVSASIITKSSDISGYITVIMSAEILRSMINDNTGLEKGTTFLLGTTHVQNQSNTTNSARLLFPKLIGRTPYPETINFPIANSSFLKASFVDGKTGVAFNVKEFSKPYMAVGYSPCTFILADWVSAVLQLQTVFFAPTVRLTKIIIVTVISVAFIMCLLTFVIANWAVQPIVRLHHASEKIAAGRGLRNYHGSRGPSQSFSGLYRVNSKGSQFSTKRDSLGTLSNTMLENNCNSGLLRFMVDRTSYPESGGANKDCTSSPFKNSEQVEAYKSPNNLIDAKIPVYRRLFSDELTELTDAFNTMTNELDRHYSLLEERVLARTKQLEEAKIQAEAANDAKTVFIANISHELRTPLNGILGMTAIAMEEKDIQKVGNSLKLIFRSGELLLHILTELLTFSKNVLKTNKLEEQSFSIIDIALQIKSIFSKLAKDQNVFFSILLIPNIIRTMVLWGDSNRIMQIIINLVSNALKFTPVDGKVVVRMKLLGEYDQERSKANDCSDIYVKPGIDFNGETQTAIYPQSDVDFMAENMYSEINKDITDDTSECASTLSSAGSFYNDLQSSFQFKKQTINIDTDNKDSDAVKNLTNSKIWVLSIEVEDTGPGIDPALHESVFKPFVQGDQTLSRQYGGTGLGLSICRQLATMMNGTIKLASQVGKGCKFTFTVPLRQSGTINFEQSSEFEDKFNIGSKKNRKVKFNINSIENDEVLEKPDIYSGNHSVKKTTTGLVDRPLLQSTGTAVSTLSISTITKVKSSTNVLVVEDNIVNQEVIKSMLLLEGDIDIDLACDGQEAFDKVSALMKRSGYYNVVFMDIQMPKVDGLLATKRIRQELHYKYPIVALTAFADDSNIKECFESGMNDFLSKPIKRPKLKTLIEKYRPSKVSSTDDPA